MTTNTERSPFDRLSSYLAGAGLGLTAGAMVAGSYLARGHDVPWGLCIAWAAAGAGVLPAAEWAARFTFALILAGLHAYSVAQASKPPTPQPPPAAPPPALDLEREEVAWSQSCRRFFTAGVFIGSFSQEKMKDYISFPAWTRMQHFYTTEEGLNLLWDYPGTRGTDLADGVTYEGIMELLDKKALPHPPGKAVVVAQYVRDTTKRNTKTKRAARGEKVIVDG